MRKVFDSGIPRRWGVKDKSGKIITGETYTNPVRKYKKMMKEMGANKRTIRKALKRMGAQ